MGGASGDPVVPMDHGKPDGIPMEHDGTFNGLDVTKHTALGGGRNDRDAGKYQTGGYGKPA